MFDAVWNSTRIIVWGVKIEIWDNKAIVNSLPARHINKAGKTLQSANLSACLQTNVIYVFVKCEIFINADTKGSK